MGALNLYGLLAIGLPLLAVHLVSVTLAKALRTYSRSRLEELCEHRGHPERADDIAHHDQRTERSAETLAVLTGLMLAALLGATSDRLVPHQTLGAMIAIALGVGGMGYVLAGVIGRVLAEHVIDTLWPWAGMLRLVMLPAASGLVQLESLAYRLTGSREGFHRPVSVEVEVEVPADVQDPENVDADLPESTRALLERAVELSTRDVGEIKRPRSAIVMLPSSVSAHEAARTFHETGKSRIPLYGENRDDIVGILYAKDLFARMTDEHGPPVLPRSLAKPAYCVPETKNPYELLDEFRSLRTQIALVLDEFGGVAGLVTLEDLIEELVGPIDDEHDEPTPMDPVVPLGGARFEVDAALSIEELNERLDLRLPTDADFLTVGGLAFHALGRLPEPGASFRQDGVEFTVVEVADHSIRRIRLDLEPAAAVGTQ